MNNKMASSKKALETMLSYYYISLLEEGYTDPKQEIATTVANTIKLSNAQKDFIKDINDVTLEDIILLVSTSVDNLNNILTKQKDLNKKDIKLAYDVLNIINKLLNK